MQQNVVTENSTITLGGAYLRQLRQDRAISIDDMAGDCGTTFKTLQKIESGKTKQPSREMLLVLLEGLSRIKRLEPIERRKVLDYFCYRDLSPLPDKDEIERMRQEWEHPFFELPHPACLVDFVHRVHAWNRYAPKMMGLDDGHPALEYTRGKTLFDLLYSKQFSNYFCCKNKDFFVFNMMEMMRYEFEPFKEEDWCKKFIKDTICIYPELRDCWDKVLGNPLRESSLRLIGPIIMEPRRDSMLKFYLLSTDFISDSRFRVIQYLPGNPETMRQCLSWVESES